MILCYFCFEMVVIWLFEMKFKIWYEIEVYVCDVQVDLGVILCENVEVVWKVCDVEFDVVWIDEIEVVIKYDVIVFFMYLVEYIGSDQVCFVYQGMISLDVLDIMLNVQFVCVVDILLVDMDWLLVVLKMCVYEYKDIVCIGCSYGIYVELIMMGLIFVCFYVEMDCNCICLVVVCEEVVIGVIFGVVGIFVNIDFVVEEYVCVKLGLCLEQISMQVIFCDWYVMFFVMLGVIVSFIENVVIEICYMQCIEVFEVEEFFSFG